MKRVVLGKVEQQKPNEPQRIVLGKVSEDYFEKNKSKIISSADLNDDNTIDMLDVVKAKNKTEASPSGTIKQMNTVATQGIRDYFFTPKYDYDIAIRDGIEKAKNKTLTTDDARKITETLKNVLGDKTLSSEEKEYYNSYLGQFQKVLESKKKLDESREEYEYEAGKKDRNYLQELADNILMGPTGLKYYKDELDKAEKEYEKDKNALYYSSLSNGKYSGKNGSKLQFITSDKERKHAYINHKSFDMDENSKEGLLGRWENVDKNLPKYRHMTEREVGIYNYLYENEGEKAADDFLGYIEDDLIARQNQTAVTTAAKFAEEYPVTSAVLSVPMAFLTAGEQVKISAQYLTGGEFERNYISDISSAMRSGLPEQVDVDIKGFDAFDFVYHTIMSGADSAAVASLGWGGAAILGLNAAASTTNDIIDRGGTDEQAFWGGIASGVFETVFEKISIGELDAMKDSVGKGIKNASKNMAKQMLVNGSEETFTEVANILYDFSFNGGISQYATLMEEYMAKNPNATEEEARSYAVKQLGLQVAEAAGSGALMGFGFGAAGSVFSHKNAASIGKAVAANGMESQVLDLALKTDKNSTAYKLAERILKSGKMRPAQIGSVVVDMMDNLSKNKAEIASDAVYKRAVALGMNESNAKDFSRQFARGLNGEKISNVIRKKFQNDSVAKQITAELQNPEGNAWVGEMNAQLETVEKATAEIRNATKISQNPILQSSAENTDTSGAESVSTDNGTFTAEEQQIINTPDNELTPEQLTVKQGLIARQQNVGQSAPSGAVESSAEGNLQSGASLDDILDESGKNERPVFREAGAIEIEREETAKQKMDTMLGRGENIKQRQIKSVAEKFGINIKWDTEVTAGYYDPDTKTIAMNPVWTLTESYYVLFKHEFMHYLENRKGYESFKKYLTDKSKAFDEYVRNKIYEKTGTAFEGTREEALEAYTKIVLEERQAAAEIPERIKRGYTTEKIHREIAADFVGEVLLGGQDIAKAEKALNEIAETNRNLFQKIMDWIKEKISILKGEPQNRTLVEDLEYLNQRLARVYDSAEKKKADRDSGLIKFSDKVIGKDSKFIVETIKNNILSIPDENLFSVKIESISDETKKSEYVLNIFESQGGIAKNEILGDVELANSGAKSTVFHGFGAKKLAATKAIKVVIEKGAIINKSENYENTGVDRYVIAGKGTIENKPSYIGVMVKAYPKQKNQKAKFYLHEAITIETDSPIMTAPQLSVDAVSESVSNNIIFNNEDFVKQKQLEIISETNPIWDEYHVGIRSVDDIRTWEEVLQLDDEREGQFVWGDYSREDAEQALKNGTITVYSSYPIKNGTFVSTSYIQAQEYAGGRNGKVYSKTVPLTEVAWINGDEGQYAKVEETDSEQSFSVSSPEFTAEVSRLTEEVKSGKITVDEFAKEVNKLAEKEHKVSEDLQNALKEQEQMHVNYVVDNARYMSQLKRRIKRQNEQLAKSRAEIREEIAADREERATKQKNIEHIRKTVSRIDKMFRTNSNTKHVPEELKEAVGLFVKIFVDNDTSPFDKRDLRQVRALYGDLMGDYNINTGDGEMLVSGFDPEILQNLRSLEKELNGKKLRDLNYHQTLLVRNIVDNINQIINSENEMFIEGKRYETDQIGQKALNELQSKNTKKENKIIRSIDSLIKYGNMTPVYFFERVGGVFKSMFNDIVVAQDKWYRNVENSKTYIRQIKEKYNYSKWGDDTFELDTEKGDKIKVSREQALLLYATAKREYGNDFKRSEHLFRGGVVVEPNKKTVKQFLGDIKNSDSKGIKKLTNAMTEEIDSRAHRITPTDIRAVFDWLTEEQCNYADALVEYLSTDMAVLGNEVTMQLYGIKKYNENYYIPYNSAQNYLYSQPGVNNEARLKHQSFTKETVHGAKTPLVLSDFSDVAADHINRMCMYNAFTIPLENMNKIFNYSKPETDINSQRNVKAEIERVYGKSAVNYIKQFLEDMNGNVRTSYTDKFLSRWVSKFKKGAVFASASVVVQQPSAVMRAMAYIDPKYFVKTTFSKTDYQEAAEYAAVAGIKEMGRFDTGVGAPTTKWLLQEKPKGFKNKVKALFDTQDSQYRDDMLSYFAGKADEITWAHIWNAVKAETQAKTNLTPGTEEFFTFCGARFTDVINRTQVYDSTLSRSQLMRDKSQTAQMLTAFMSEPTVSLNILMDATLQTKAGGKGKKFAARAIASLVGNVLLNAALKSLVTAARDDDEEETYLEKYLSSFTDNALSDLLLVNYIPFIKDIVSIFSGYTVERADMSLFQDLYNAIRGLDSNKKSTYRKIEDFAGALASFLGLPVKNVMRDVRAANNLCNDIFITDKNDIAVKKEADSYIEQLSDNATFESLDEEDKEELEEKVLDTVRDIHEAQNDKKQSDHFDKLYEALRRGGNKSSQYKELKQKMLDEGLKQSEITEGLEIARIAYMKTQGVDVNEYLLYKKATSKKYADKDNSGGVDKQEKRNAINNADLSSKAKRYFLNNYK